ncbi:hypothetical protein, conserved [Plasmodium ovale wallikeri]|uniref:Uncharacterized protein n=1 Tax=Plasmodium ovale wallikeri TaxID=864142 RepID=A0A1A8YX27_PLAOA|nr:hypothetical protein, conserved [Plasmodium ovale wallikeri]
MFRAKPGGNTKKRIPFQEYLGEWDAIENLTINSVTSPEILLKNVPFPEKLFELAELPFEIVYSNIKSLRIKFLWSSIFSNNISPISIYANDLFLVIKFSYPSSWDTNRIMNHQYNLKKNKLIKWDSINISKEKNDESFLRALPVKLVNSLRILAENIKIIFFDNYIHKNPFTLEFIIKKFKIDELNKYKVKLTEEEKKNIRKNLLINIWIRLIGVHMIYKEFTKKIKYKKQPKKRKKEDLQKNEKGGDIIGKSKNKENATDELVLLAIENLFSESASSVQLRKKVRMKKKKRKLVVGSAMGHYCSFSDYDIDERIKGECTKSRKSKTKRKIGIDRGGNQIPSKMADAMLRNKKKIKNNYNFEIPKHDTGFRITAKDGLDMHVIFKKYDMKALNDLKSNLKCFKNVELSFVKHCKKNIDDDVCNNVKNEQKEQTKKSFYCFSCSRAPPIQDNDDSNFYVSNMLSDYDQGSKRSYNEEMKNYDQVMERNFRNDYPPLFSNINNYEHVNVYFTSSCLDAFCNFVRFIEFWFLYKGGCTKIFNILPSIEDCIKYSEHRKLRNEKNYKYDEYIEQFIEKFEASCPTHLLTKLRLLSDECIYSKEYFNNAHLKKREWKKLLYNFIKNRKGDISLLDENVEKLDRWFSHDMLFNLVIPQIDFTYVPIKFNHFSNSKIRTNKCLLSYNINCSFLFKQEKTSTIKKKVNIYMHNLDIQSLFVIFRKNKKFVINEKKYSLHYVEKLPIRNYCLYIESNENNHHLCGSIHQNFPNHSIIFPPFNDHFKEEHMTYINREGGGIMMNFQGVDTKSGDKSAEMNPNGISRKEVIPYNSFRSHNEEKHSFDRNDHSKEGDDGKRTFTNVGEKRDGNVYAKVHCEQGIVFSNDSHDTIKELSKNMCLNDIMSYNMCGMFSQHRSSDHLIEGDNGDRISMESLRSFDKEIVEGESGFKNEEEAQSAQKGVYQESYDDDGSNNGNDNGSDREEGHSKNLPKDSSNRPSNDISNDPSNSQGKKGFWKFILGKPKKETAEEGDKKCAETIDDSNFDLLMNNKVSLIPNTLIITINDYSNNVREIDVNICKYVVNVNNLLPIVNFIPTNNTCLELFLKYDNYIDKEVIEILCLCISSSSSKKKIVRLRFNEIKAFFVHAGFIENEIINLKNYICKMRRKKKIRRDSFSHEKFIEHDVMMDPFKSMTDKIEGESEKKNIIVCQSELYKEVQSASMQSGGEYDLKKRQKGYNYSVEFCNDSTSDASGNTNMCKDEEEGDVNTHGRKYILYENKNVENFVRREENDITNIHNIIFNNLCYTKNMSKKTSRNLLSIGFFFQVKNLFLFYDKDDSLMYVQSDYVSVQHMFHPCFLDENIRLGKKNNFETDTSLRYEGVKSNCDGTDTSRETKEREKSMLGDGTSKAIKMAMENIKNKSVLVCIKWLMVKRNGDVISIRMNTVNCSWDEISVSLLAIYKCVVPFDQLELIKMRINKFRNIKQFLVINNKNTVHLSRYNVTNGLLYKMLNKYFLANHMKKEEPAGIKVERSENLPVVNKNYEKKKGNTMKNVKNAYSASGANDASNVGNVMNVINVINVNDEKNSDDTPFYNTQNVNDNRRRQGKNGRFIHRASDGVLSSGSNDDVMKYFQTDMKRVYIVNPINSSKSLDREYYTCKEDTMLSSNENDDNNDSHKNAYCLNSETEEESHELYNGIDEYTYEDPICGERKNKEGVMMQQTCTVADESNLVRPSKRYYNEHCKYMNLRNLFNYDESDKLDVLLGEDIFMHSSMSNVDSTEVGYLKRDNIEKEKGKSKQTILFFLLVHKTNVCVKNKNEGIFKVVCSDFMSEVSYMHSSINLSLKIKSCYLFYLLPILRKRSQQKIGNTRDERGAKRYMKKGSDPFCEREKNEIEENTCKKYVILTDTVSNIFAVSKSSLKKKKKKFPYNQYKCILEKKKFKLYINYVKKKINAKDQIHVDIHINKETCENIIKLSVTNFHFFYSSTLFVLLNDVVVNNFLSYIQEREKMNTIACKYSSIGRYQKFAYLWTHGKTDLLSRHQGKNSTECTSFVTLEKKNNEIVESLEKWISSNSIIDNLGTTSSDSFANEAHADFVESYNIVGKKNKKKDLLCGDIINLTNNTFYYDFSEDEKGVGKSLNIEDDTVAEASIVRMNGGENGDTKGGESVGDPSNGPADERAIVGMYKQLYDPENMTYSEKIKNSLNEKIKGHLVGRKFIDFSSSAHGRFFHVASSENANPIVFNEDEENEKRSANQNLQEYDMKRKLDESAFDFYNNVEEENGEEKEAEMQILKRGDSKNGKASTPSVNEVNSNTFFGRLKNSYHFFSSIKEGTLKDHHVGINKGLQKKYNPQNICRLDEVCNEQNELRKYADGRNEREGVKDKWVGSSPIRGTNAKKYLNRKGRTSMMVQRQHEEEERADIKEHDMENKQKSENVKFFICLENVNICYLINYHRFRYFYKRNYNVDAYMNDYINFVDSCANYCKEGAALETEEIAETREASEKGEEAHSLDHIGIMNKDLYNVNLNFLLRLEYFCSKGRKKRVSVHFPFLYVILMKNFNYVISHMTVVDVKFIAELIQRRNRKKGQKCKQKGGNPRSINFVESTENQGIGDYFGNYADCNDDAALNYFSEDEFCIHSKEQANKGAYQGRNNLHLLEGPNCGKFKIGYNSSAYKNKMEHNRSNLLSDTFNSMRSQDKSLSHDYAGNINYRNDKDHNTNSSTSLNYRIENWRSRTSATNARFCYDTTKDVRQDGHNSLVKSSSEYMKSVNKENIHIRKNKTNELRHGNAKMDSLSSDQPMNKQKSYIKILFNYKRKKDTEKGDCKRKDELVQSGTEADAADDVEQVREANQVDEVERTDEGKKASVTSHRRRLLKHFNTVINFIGKNNNTPKQSGKRGGRRSLSLLSIRSQTNGKKKTNNWNQNNTLDMTHMCVDNNAKSCDMLNMKRNHFQDAQHDSSISDVNANKDVRIWPYYSIENYRSSSRKGSKYMCDNPSRSARQWENTMTVGKFHEKTTRKSHHAISYKDYNGKDLEYDEMNKRRRESFTNGSEKYGVKESSKTVQRWKLVHFNLSIYNINLFSCIYVRRFKKGGEIYLQPLVYNYMKSNKSYSIPLQSNNDKEYNSSFIKNNFERYNNIMSKEYIDFVKNNCIVERELNVMEFINELYNLEWFNKFNAHHLSNINRIHSYSSNFMWEHNVVCSGNGRVSNRRIRNSRENTIVCCYIPIFYKNVPDSYRNIYKLFLLTRYYESVPYLSKVKNEMGKMHNACADNEKYFEKKRSQHIFPKSEIRHNRTGKNKRSHSEKERETIKTAQVENELITDTGKHNGKYQMSRDDPMYMGRIVNKNSDLLSENANINFTFDRKQVKIRKYESKYYEDALMCNGVTKHLEDFHHFGEDKKHMHGKDGDDCVSDGENSNLLEYGKLMFPEEYTRMRNRSGGVGDDGVSSACGSFNNYLVYKRDFLKYSSWKENHVYVSLREVESMECTSARQGKKKKCLNFYIKISSSGLNTDPYFMSTCSFYLMNNLNKNIVLYDIQETKAYFNYKFRQLKRYYDHLVESNGVGGHETSFRKENYKERYMHNGEGTLTHGKRKTNKPLDGGKTSCGKKNINVQGTVEEEIIPVNLANNHKLYRFMNQLNNISLRVKEKLKNKKVLFHVDISNIDINILDSSYIYDSNYLLLNHVHPFYNDKYFYISKEQYEKIKKKNKESSNSFIHLESLEKKKYSCTMNELIFNQFTNYYKENLFYIISFDERKIKRVSMRLYATVMCNNVNKYEHTNDVLSVIIYNYRIKFSSLQLKRISNITKSEKTDIENILNEMETENTILKKKKYINKERRNRMIRNSIRNIYKQISNDYKEKLNTCSSLQDESFVDSSKNNFYRKVLRSSNNVNNSDWFFSDWKGEEHISSSHVFFSSPSSTIVSSDDTSSAGVSSENVSFSMNSLLSYNSKLGYSKSDVLLTRGKKNRRYSTIHELPNRMYRHRLSDNAYVIRKNGKREIASFSDSMYTKNSSSLRCVGYEVENEKSVCSENSPPSKGNLPVDKCIKKERDIKKRKIKMRFFHYVKKLYKDISSKNKRSKLVLNNIIEKNKWCLDVDNMVFFLPMFNKGFRFSLYIYKIIIYDYGKINICNNISKYRLFIKNNVPKSYVQLCNKIQSTFYYLNMNSKIAMGNIKRKINLDILRLEIYNDQFYMIANENGKHVDFSINVKNTRFILHNKSVMNLINYFTELTNSFFSFLYVYSLFPDIPPPEAFLMDSSHTDASHLNSCINVENFKKGLLLYNSLLNNYIGMCKSGRSVTGDKMGRTTRSSKKKKKTSLANKYSLVQPTELFSEESECCGDRVYVEKISSNDTYERADSESILLSECESSALSPICRKIKKRECDISSEASTMNCLVEKLFFHKRNINYKYLIMNKYEYHTRDKIPLRELNDRSYYFLAFINNNLMFFLYFYTRYKTVLNYASREYVFSLRNNYTYPVKNVKFGKLINTKRIYENIKNKKKFISVGSLGLCRKHSEKDQLIVSSSKIKGKKRREKKKNKIRKYSSRYCENAQHSNRIAYKKHASHGAYYSHGTFDRNSMISIQEECSPGDSTRRGINELHEVDNVRAGKRNRGDVTNYVGFKNEHEDVDVSSIAVSLKYKKPFSKLGSLLYEKNKNEAKSERKKNEDNGEIHEAKGLSRKIKTTIQRFFTRKLSSNVFDRKKTEMKKKKSSITNISNNFSSDDYHTMLQKKGDTNDVVSQKADFISFTNLHNFRSKCISIKMKINLLEIWVIQDDLLGHSHRNENKCRRSYFLKKKKKNRLLEVSDSQESVEGKGKEENVEKMKKKKKKKKNRRREGVSSEYYTNEELCSVIKATKKSKTKSFTSSNSGSNLNILNILEKSKNYFNTYMNKKINKQIFYMARKIKMSKQNDDDLDENQRGATSRNRNTIKGKDIDQKEVSLRVNNTLECVNANESISGCTEYSHGTHEKTVTNLLNKSKSSMNIPSEMCMGESDIFKPSSSTKRRMIAYRKWKKKREKKREKKKNITDSNRNICLAVIFSTDIYFKEQKNKESSKMKIAVNNLNIMVGKCFNFYEIHDKLKLYRSTNNFKNFRTSVYNSTVLDLNYINKSSVKSGYYLQKNNRSYTNKDPTVLKKELEYAFYDNTNFYNIHYNEMKDLKTVRGIIKKKKGAKRQRRFENNDEENHFYSQPIKDHLSYQNGRNRRNVHQLKKKSWENVATRNSFEEREYSGQGNAQYIYNNDMRRSKGDVCTAYFGKENERKQKKKLNHEWDDLFFFTNKSKILYKDKFNIFLNQNNNIFMPNMKDENDWLLNMNSVYVNINSLSVKKTFKIIFHELLINMTIDNTKDLHKFYRNFIYIISYVQFYKSYVTFVNNVYIVPFLQKNKNWIDKSNEKLRINKVYLNNMNKLKVLNKQLFYKKVKKMKRKYSMSRKKDVEVGKEGHHKFYARKECILGDITDFDYGGRAKEISDEMACGKANIAEKSKRQAVFTVLRSPNEGTDEEENCSKMMGKMENDLNGNMYNLVREKTIFVQDVQEEKYIRSDLTTVYNVRREFLIKNLNLHKKMTESYAKLQTFIDVENVNTRYSRIVSCLKEKYARTEICKEELYYLYSQLFSIIRYINSEKNMICHGLIFMNLLNCFHAYRNKYITNLFYYLFIFSKYNKFAYYLCTIQKHFDYKYFTFFTDKLRVNTDLDNDLDNGTLKKNYEKEHSYTHNTHSYAHDEEGYTLKSACSENGITSINNKSKQIMNENFSLKKEINENIKKEEVLKENDATQRKNFSCFIISMLLYLYKPYMYTYKKREKVRNKKGTNIGGEISRKRTHRLQVNCGKETLMHRGSTADSDCNSMDTIDYAKNARKNREPETANDREICSEFDYPYGMKEEKGRDQIKTLDSVNSSEYNSGSGKVLMKKPYLFSKKGKKIKIKFRMNNICFKIHQLNKENILTLNLYDLSYFMFVCLYKYHFFFYNTNEHVSFCLNENVKKISFEDVYAMNEGYENRKSGNRKLGMDSIWYELSDEDSLKEKDVILELKRKQRKERKKNSILVNFTFKISLKTYDNMYNIQDNIVNPITFTFLINEKFKHFPILYVHFYTTSININITTSFLYLYKYLFSNLNFKNDLNDVKNSYIEIYNDLHSEIIIFYKTRTKNNKYIWKLNIIDKNEYHQFPCECLYFCINKKKERNKINSEFYGINKNSDDFIIANENDLNNVFRDICKIGLKKKHIYNSVAKQEKHLLYDNTQSVYDILYQFTYKMPFLYKNHDEDNKIINIIKKKASWIYIGVLYTDDLYSRAYKVPNVRLSGDNCKRKREKKKKKKKKRKSKRGVLK